MAEGYPSSTSDEVIPPEILAFIHGERDPDASPDMSGFVRDACALTNDELRRAFPVEALYDEWKKSQDGVGTFHEFVASLSSEQKALYAVRIYRMDKGAFY